jgi:hypothetical protein
MNSHIVINREKGYKNKRTAQNVGIAVAKTAFNMMIDPDFRSFMVSWDKPILLDRAGEDLFIYFPNSPKNLDELKSIASDSAKVEFEILKASYNGELPVSKFTDTEIIETVTSITTKNFLMGIQVDFYDENRKLENIDNVWKDLFVARYSINDLLTLANQRAHEVFLEKSISQENQAAILVNIETFWHKITDLKSKLYSSR